MDALAIKRMIMAKAQTGTAPAPVEPPRIVVPTSAKVALQKAADADAAMKPSLLPLNNQVAIKVAAIKQAFGPEAVESGYENYAEIKRIVQMPVIHEMTAEEVEAYSATNILAGAYNDGFRFLRTQAMGGWNYEMYGGGFFPIGVGWGKTLLSLLVSAKAYSKGKGKGILTVPSHVFPQLTQKDIAWARSRIPIPYPIHLVGGRDAGSREAIAKSGKKGLYILTHTQFSNKDAWDIIKAIKPEFMVIDEAHNFAKATAARTKRLLNYLKAERFNGTPVEGVAMSGTITQKTIMDYHHLISWVLGDFSPIPLSDSLAREWAAVVDSEAVSFEGSEAGGGTGPLKPLVQWARIHFPQEAGGITDDVAGFRRAFKCRLNSAPGVVSSKGLEIGTSLVMINKAVENYKLATGYSQLEKLIEDVENLWLTPNGDEIEYAIHSYKWLYELSSGFYNRLYWPTAEHYKDTRHLSIQEAQDLLARSQYHHKQGQRYAKDLRDWLKYKSKPGLDSPFLVGGSMLRHEDKEVGRELYEVWKFWKSTDFDGRPDRESNCVRVCSYKLDAAIKHCVALHKATNQGILLWFYHNEMGHWAKEVLAAHDVPMLYCPAGDAHNASIIDHKNANKIVIASISAHGEGKNLQHFQHNYVLQWPRNAKVAEQLLGRTHRTGQLADELEIVTNNTSTFDQMVFAATLNDALYIHQTLGTRQKLIYSNYDPLPKIFPPQVLMQRGLEIKKLGVLEQKALEERFGV